MSLPPPGSAFGPFNLGATLGRGAMGVVYAARHRGLDRDVALKLLAPHLADDEDYRQRFMREAKVLAKLDSPFVVRVYDTGTVEGWWYIATELISGGDLKARIDAGPLSTEEALRLVREVGVGLSVAHAQGILHRDIKPSNVLLRRIDGRDQAVLCDLGISGVTDSDQTRTSTVVGTLGYLAPERHRGEYASVRSDVYALGCLLWACLSGRAPYLGSDVDVAMGHIQGQIPVLAGTGPAVAGINAVLQKSMAKDPAARYASAADFVAALDGIGSADLAETIVGPAPAAAAPLPQQATRPLPILPAAVPPPPVGLAPPAGFASPPAYVPPSVAATRSSVPLVASILVLALLLGAGIVTAVVLSSGGNSPSAAAANTSSTPPSSPPTSSDPRTYSASPVQSASAAAVCGPGTNYDRRVLDDGPLAYVPLDDVNSGSICNAVSAAAAGPYVSGVTGSQDAPGSATGSAYATAGIGSVPTPAITGRSGFTAEAWFRSGGVVQDQALVATGDGNTKGSRIGLAAWSSDDSSHSKSIRCDRVARSTIGLDTVSSSNCFDTGEVGIDLWDGQWHYLAVTVDPSGAATAVIDGESLPSQSLDAGSLDLVDASSMVLGMWRGNSVNRPMSGSLARAAMYGRALDVSTLRDRYDLGR